MWLVEILSDEIHAMYTDRSAGMWLVEILSDEIHAM